MSSHEYTELKARIVTLEKEFRKMSEEIRALHALVTKVVSDVIAKLASISTEGLSEEDKATVSSITAALTDLDNKVTGPDPASPDAPPAA